VRNFSRIALALLPILLPLSAWKAAVLIADRLGCGGLFSKDHVVCFVAHHDIGSTLQGANFLGIILWPLGLIVSGFLLGRTLRGFLFKPWGTRTRT
jgi:hypothetical protein